jgi:hypothetical protein
MALSWLHVREQGVNGGFNDAGFELLLKMYGWKMGYAWCMFFCKAVWCVCYRDTPHYERVVSTLNGSVMDSYRKAKLDGWKVTDAPVIGGILIFDAGNGKGHACICKSIKEVWNARTVEGNTNKAGSREGDAVMEKLRILNANKGKLRYVGCINPFEDNHGNNTKATTERGAE